VVNIKPILPGHVLVIPHRQCQRLTDLGADEVTDLFTTVQKVQRMLARSCFAASDSNSPGKIEDGSFNIALQDGPDSGQTVRHVHCHIIPRRKYSNEGDEIYDRLQSEEGNVGGGLWDLSRPKQARKFPKIEEAERKPRSAEEMNREAAFYREQMTLVGNEQ
jgi:bis(5'-adenosyl)-triphosphatase